MKFFLFLLIACSANLSAKIYDCFLFFNEIDLLKIRFEELYDTVDYFVLVEAQEGFRGNDKPLYFELNKKLFSEYEDKIIHVKLEKKSFNSPWDRESWQRNQIMRGLQDCVDSDIVMISDLDEFIDARKWPDFLELLTQKEGSIVGCHSYFYRCFFNRKSQKQWVGTAVTNYSTILSLTPQGVRNLRCDDLVVSFGGWHFSNMGGLITYVEKIESFSHAEADTKENKDPRIIDNYIRSNLTLEQIDETFPKFLRGNVEYYLSKGLIDYSDRPLSNFFIK